MRQLHEPLMKLVPSGRRIALLSPSRGSEKRTKMLTEGDKGADDVTESPVLILCDESTNSMSD